MTGCCRRDRQNAVGSPVTSGEEQTCMTSEEFEEHVQRECVRILRAVHHQQWDDVESRVTDLCELAEDRQNQRKKLEAASPDTRDRTVSSLSSGSADVGAEGRESVPKRLRR